MLNNDVRKQFFLASFFIALFFFFGLYYFFLFFIRLVRNSLEGMCFEWRNVYSKIFRLLCVLNGEMFIPKFSTCYDPFIGLLITNSF